MNGKHEGYSTGPSHSIHCLNRMVGLETLCFSFLHDNQSKLGKLQLKVDSELLHMYKP